MGNKKVRYVGKLSGIEDIEVYIDKLKSCPAYSYKEIVQKHKRVFVILGPKKSIENIDNLEFSLYERAKKIGIYFPEKVERTKQSILNAHKAEQIVLSGNMQIAVSYTHLTLPTN